jgi:hypothetical protein
VEHLNGALISGCRTDQTSTDALIFGRYNGAATYYLLQELKDGGLSRPLESVVANLNATLDKNGYEQDPQLKGSPSACANSLLSL